MRATSLRSLLVATSFLVVGCGGQTQDEQATIGLSDAERSQMVDNFRSATRERLDEVDRKIQLLTERADSITEDLQAELQSSIASFQVRSEQVEEELRYVAWESETAWEDNKARITRRLDALARDVDDRLHALNTST